MTAPGASTPHLTAPPSPAKPAAGDVLVQVRDLTMAIERRVLMRGLNFDVHAGEVLVIMGGSGCGKSTLLRHLIGLATPAHGTVCHGGQDLAKADARTLSGIRQRFGVTYQSGALWSSMTVGENVMLPLQLFTPLSTSDCRDTARAALAQVDMADSFDKTPDALSGGMKKRAAIARAMVLKPPLLFLDEPSAGLDPPTAANLDDLILKLKHEQGTAVVLVTHELDSIFAVADRALFLDAASKTMTALDNPHTLLDHGAPPVRHFLQPRPHR
jgi:phospholipid/cholesterol/gamma-HCH transport system ATP-binding protein